MQSQKIVLVATPDPHHIQLGISSSTMRPTVTSHCTEKLEDKKKEFLISTSGKVALSLCPGILYPNKLSKAIFRARTTDQVLDLAKITQVNWLLLTLSSKNQCIFQYASKT